MSAEAIRETSATDRGATVTGTTARRLITPVGLAIGVAFGASGNFATGHTQNMLYTVSSVGIVIGGFLLVARFARRRNDIVAVGLTIWVLGEVVVMSGGRPSQTAAYTLAAIAAGFGLYAIGLALASLPSELPVWSRVPGILAAIPFAAHVVWWELGHNVDQMGTLAGLGYGLMALTMVTWIVYLLRDQERSTA